MFWGVAPSQHSMALGTIEMWGEIVEHERGYRASFARVKSIDIITRDDKLPITIEELRDRYGV
jgi:hypothetical protein